MGVGGKKGWRGVQCSKKLELGWGREGKRKGRPKETERLLSKIEGFGVDAKREESVYGSIIRK